MVFFEVDFEGIVVDKVLLLASAITPIADMAAFVLVSTVCVQLVVSVEALSTEATFRVSLEAALVDRTRVVVTELLVLPQFGECKQLVFVRKDLLVSCTQVTVSISHGPTLAMPLHENITTHHITLPCAVLTWRCRSGQPKQATSQSPSGQLYCSNRRVSSKTCGFSKCMPRLSFDWKKSAAVKFS
jgi:hypothetical protein